MNSMTEAHARAIFLLARIDATTFFKLENLYWPEAYAEERRNSPWWLVKTPVGLVIIGWRKRVISIDWSDTPMRRVVTEDDVTKNGALVHAYSYAKAVEYLGVLATYISKSAQEPIPQLKEQES